MTGYDQVQRRMLLLGYLTESTTVSSHQLNYGCLYLQDNTDAVICEVLF